MPQNRSSATVQSSDSDFITDTDFIASRDKIDHDKIARLTSVLGLTMIAHH